MQNLSRRSLLRGAAAVPALFVSSHTLALGSASGATSEPWDDTASIGNSSGAVVRLSARANALLESLDSAQRKAASSCVPYAAFSVTGFSPMVFALRGSSRLANATPLPAGTDCARRRISNAAFTSA
jgi:hypothetical protein